MSYNHEINEKFPIRKTADQKSAFLRYATEKAQEMGYKAQVEQIRSNRNLIVGDPESAKVLFTAHYDTPAVMPFPNFITPRSIPFYLLFSVLMAGCFILAGTVIMLACQALFKITDPGTLYMIFMGTYFIFLMLMLMGPANKNNRNDNTSGTAALLDIMERLSENARKNVAFIFFDNEEKHLQGSGSFAKKHPEIKQNTLVINLDCVGDGKHFFCFAKRGAAAHSLYPLLMETPFEAEDKYFRHFPALGSVYPSDQANFRCGIAVCACKKAPVIGYYINRIHTVRDTICDDDNLSFLAENFTAFAENIPE